MLREAMLPPSVALPLHAAVAAIACASPAAALRPRPAAAALPAVGCSAHVTDPEDSLRWIDTSVYISNVTVGTPPQQFRVLIDTGSAHLWLPSAECNQMPCLVHSRYFPEASVTSRAPAGDLETSTTFVSGELVGHPVHDRVCFGPGVCADMDFLIAHKESDYPFYDLPFDGILGLGFYSPSHTTARASNAGWELLRQAGLGVFAACLGDLSERSPGVGQVIFAKDSSELPMFRIASGKVAWAPLAPDAEAVGYWLVRLLSVRVGDQPIITCAGGPGPAGGACLAAVDTGSEQVFGPEALLDKIQTKLDVREDCSRLAALPIVEFELQGDEGPFALSLTATDYVQESLSRCSAGFEPLNMTSGVGVVWILGQILLRKYVSVYDLTNRRVGFAPRVADPRCGMGEAVPRQLLETAQAKGAGFTVASEKRLPLEADERPSDRTASRLRRQSQRRPIRLHGADATSTVV